MSPIECSGFQKLDKILVDEVDVVIYQKFNDGIEHTVRPVNTAVTPLPIRGLKSGGGYLNGEYLEPGRKVVARGMYLKAT